MKPGGETEQRLTQRLKEKAAAKGYAQRSRSLTGQGLFSGGRPSGGLLSGVSPPPLSSPPSPQKRKPPAHNSTKSPPRPASHPNLLSLAQHRRHENNPRNLLSAKALKARAERQADRQALSASQSAILTGGGQDDEPQTSKTEDQSGIDLEALAEAQAQIEDAQAKLSNIESDLERGAFRGQPITDEQRLHLQAARDRAQADLANAQDFLARVQAGEENLFAELFGEAAASDNAIDALILRGAAQEIAEGGGEGAVDHDFAEAKAENAQKSPQTELAFVESILGEIEMSDKLTSGNRLQELLVDQNVTVFPIDDPYSDDAKLLDLRGIEGSIGRREGGRYDLTLRLPATRSTLIEELVQLQHYRSGKFDEWIELYDATSAPDLSEYEAAKFLVENKTRFEIPDNEHQTNLRRLEFYIRALDSGGIPHDSR